MTSVSLWETLLKNCSKRSKINEGIILYSGNNDSGKFSLLQALCNSNSNSKNITKSAPNLPTYVLLHENNEIEFDNSNTMNENDSDNDSNKLHNWIINKNILLTIHKNILNEVNSEMNIGLVITLDLSKDPIENIKILRQWIKDLCQYIIQDKFKQPSNNHSKSNSNSNSNSNVHTYKSNVIEKQQLNRKYIDLAQKHHGNKTIYNNCESLHHQSDTNTNTGSDIGIDSDKEPYLPVPIVIIGTKVDLIDVHNTQLKEFYAYVRYICLECE